MSPIITITAPTDAAQGRVTEQSITATTNTDLPAWYRTDTPHHAHRHTVRDSRCLPDKP